MEFSEKQKLQMIEFIEKAEGVKADEAFRIQIQNVIREHAKLSAFLEVGMQILNSEMDDLKSLKESSSVFLKDAVKIARKMNIQVQ